MAEKKCNSIEEKCKQQEAYFLLDPVLTVKREIALIQTPLSQQSALGEAINADRLHYSEITYRLEKYKALQQELWKILKSDTFGDRQRQERAAELIGDPELQGDEKLLQHSVTLAFFKDLIFSTLYFYLKDQANAQLALERCIALFKTHAAMLSQNFMALMHLFLVSCRIYFWLESDNDKTIAWVEEFKNLTEHLPMAPANRNYLLQSIHNNLLASYSNPPHHKGRSEELQELLQIFEQDGPVEISEMLPQIYINAALIYTMNRDHSKALPYLEKILGTRHSDLRVDTFVFANLIRLLAVIQDGDPQYLENTYRSVSRYLKRSDYLPKTQEAVLALARNVMRAENPQQLRQAFLTFRERVAELEQDPLERSSLNYVGFYFYIDQELEHLKD